MNVSELICVRLLPTGSCGGGGGGGGAMKEEEGAEHPLIMAIMHKHKNSADMANILRIVQSIQRKHIKAKFRIKTPETSPLNRFATESAGYPEPRWNAK